MVKKIVLAATAVAALVGLSALPAAAKDWSTVRIGIEGAFPPWNATGPDGKLTGLDVEIAKDLCARAKVKCELVQNEWSSIIPSLNAGKFDLVMTLGINEQRKKVVDFTVPYASGAATFLILKDGPVKPLPMTGERLNLNDKAKADPVMVDIHDALKGKIVGVVASTSHEQLIRSYFGDDVTVRTYKSSPERDLDLKAGRIDAAFDSAVYGASILGTPDNADIQMSGPLLKGAMLATEVAIGLRKSEPELKAIFDKAIQEASADGTIQKLSLQWAKIDLSPSLPPQ
jgi:lysine-arginine-ornithine-binding protein